MNDLQKIIMILRDYEADSKTGYVINLDHYIESRCHVLNISEYKDDILMIISKTIKPFVCTVLT
jgi:hypothetical protein